MTLPTSENPVQCQWCRACPPIKSSGPIYFEVPIKILETGGTEYLATFQIDFDPQQAQRVHLVDVHDETGQAVAPGASLQARMNQIIEGMNQAATCGRLPYCPHGVQERARKSNLPPVRVRQILGEIPYLAQLSSEQLDRLERRSRIKTLSRQECLYADGASCQGFFIVLRGLIKIYRTSYEGRPFNLLALQPGDVFGEEAALRNEAHLGTAEAISEVTLLQIDADAFRHLVETDFGFARKVLGTLAEKNARMHIACASIAIAQSTSRIARFLDEELTRHEKNPIRLRLPKYEIASLIGIVPETFSRGLRRLQRDGVIGVKGPNIFVEDREALRRLALCG